MKLVKAFPISQLKLFKGNPRKHGELDVTQLVRSIETFGWTNPILAQTGTNRVIAGHGRIEAARRIGRKTVPVVFLDMTDKDADAYTIVDNRLAELSEWDFPALKDLMAELDSTSYDLTLTGFATDEIEKMFAHVKSEAHDSEHADGADDAEREWSAETRGIYALREDALFPSTNDWGIPDLRADRLSTQVPTRTWAGGACEQPADCVFIYRTAKFPADARGGVLAFYVEDWRFENLWSDAVSVVEQFQKFGWGAIVSPDYSVWQDDPRAVQLFNVYRSRWCARYWQEVGIPVIPSLCWDDERSRDFAYAGLPERIPVASIQCRTVSSKRGQQFFLKGAIGAIQRVKPETLLIYGGATHRQWIEPELPTECRYVWLESWTDGRRRRGAV